MRQFTATCYILNEEKILLIFHRKFKKWMPPGGHLEPNETPAECAVREALEETGLHVEIFSDDLIEVDNSNAVSIPRPFLCMIEEIPPYKDQPAHQHVDSLYVGRPVGGEESAHEEETEGMHWFTKEELLELRESDSVFVEVVDIALLLIERYASYSASLLN